MDNVVELDVRMPKIDMSEFQPVLDAFKQVDTVMSTFSENIGKTTKELDSFAQKGEKQFSGLTAQAKSFSAEVNGIRENVGSGSKEFEGMVKHYNDMYAKADAADDNNARMKANEYGRRALDIGTRRSDFARTRASETLAIGDAMGFSEGVREKTGFNPFDQITPYLDIKSQEAALRKYSADVQKLTSKWAPTISSTINGLFNGGHNTNALMTRGRGNSATYVEGAMENFTNQIEDLTSMFFGGKSAYGTRGVKFNPQMVKEFQQMGKEGESAVAEMISQAVMGRVGPSNLPGVKQMLGGTSAKPITNIQQMLTGTAFQGMFDKVGKEGFSYAGREQIAERARLGMSFTSEGLAALTRLASSNPLVANALLNTRNTSGASGSAGRAAYQTAGMGTVLNVSKVGDVAAAMDDLAKGMLIGINGTSEATMKDGTTAKLMPGLMSGKDASGRRISTYNATSKYGLGGSTDTLIDTIAGDLEAQKYSANAPRFADFGGDINAYKAALAAYNKEHGGNIDTHTASRAMSRLRQGGSGQKAMLAANELMSIITNPDYTTDTAIDSIAEIPFTLDAGARGRNNSFVVEKIEPFSKKRLTPNTIGLKNGKTGDVIGSTWGTMDESGFTRALGLGYADRGEKTDLIKEINLEGMDPNSDKDEEIFRQMLIDTGVAYKDDKGNLQRKADSEYVFHTSHGQSGVSARLIRRDAYEAVEKQFAEKFSIPFAKKYGLIDQGLEGAEAMTAAQKAVGTFWNNMTPETENFAKIPELAKEFDNRNKRWSPGIDYRGGAIDWLNGGKDIYGNDISFEGILNRITGSSSGKALDAGGRTPRTALVDFAPLWQKLGGAAKYGFESGSEGQSYLNEEFAAGGTYQGRGGFAGKGIFSNVGDMAKLLAEGSGNPANIIKNEDGSITYSIDVPSGYDNSKTVRLTSTYDKNKNKIGGNYDAFIDTSMQKDYKKTPMAVYKAEKARAMAQGMSEDEAAASAAQLANEALSVQYAASPDYVMNFSKDDSSTKRIGKQAAQWIRFSPSMMQHQGQALNARINQLKTISGMAQMFGGSENPNSYFAQGLSGLDPNFKGDATGFYYANQDEIDNQVNNYITSLQKASISGEFINHDSKLGTVTTLGNRVKTKSGIDNERLVTNPWTALLSTYGITQDPEQRAAWASIVDNGIKKSVTFDEQGLVAEGALKGMSKKEIEAGRGFLMKARKEFSAAKGSDLTGDQTMGVLTMTGYGKEGDKDYLPAGYADFEHKNQIAGGFLRSPTGFNQIAGGINYAAIGYGGAFKKLSGQKDGVLFNFGDMQRLAGADWDGDMIKALTSGKYSIENIPGLEDTKNLKGNERNQALLKWMRSPDGYAALRASGKIGGTNGSIVDDTLNTIDMLDRMGFIDTDTIEKNVEETRNVQGSTDLPTGDMATDLAKDARRRVNSPMLMALTSGVGSRLSGLDLTEKSNAFWANLALESNKLYDIGTTYAKKPKTYKLTPEDWKAYGLGPEFAKAAEFLDGRFAVRGDAESGYTGAGGVTLKPEDVFDYNGVAMDISGNDTKTGLFKRVGAGGMKIDTFQLMSRTNKSQVMGSLAAQMLKQSGNFDSSIGEATRAFITSDAEYRRDKNGNLVLDDEGDLIRTGGGLGFGLADSAIQENGSRGLESTRRMLKNFRGVFAYQTNGNATMMSEATRDILANNLIEAKKEISDYSKVAASLDPKRWTIKEGERAGELMQSAEIEKQLYKDFGIAAKEMAVDSSGHEIKRKIDGQTRSEYLRTAFTPAGLMDSLVGNAMTKDENGKPAWDQRKLAEARQTARMLLSTYDFNEQDTGIVDNTVDNYHRQNFQDVKRSKKNAEILGVSDLIPEGYFDRKAEVNTTPKEQPKVEVEKPVEQPVEKPVEKKSSPLADRIAKINAKKETTPAKKEEIYEDDGDDRDMINPQFDEQGRIYDAGAEKPKETKITANQQNEEDAYYASLAAAMPPEVLDEAYENKKSKYRLGNFKSQKRLSKKVPETSTDAGYYDSLIPPSEEEVMEADLQYMAYSEEYGSRQSGGKKVNSPASEALWKQRAKEQAEKIVSKKEEENFADKIQTPIEEAKAQVDAISSEIENKENENIESAISEVSKEQETPVKELEDIKPDQSLIDRANAIIANQEKARAAIEGWRSGTLKPKKDKNKKSSEETPEETPEETVSESSEPTESNDDNNPQKRNYRLKNYNLKSNGQRIPLERAKFDLWSNSVYTDENNNGSGGSGGGPGGPSGPDDSDDSRKPSYTGGYKEHFKNNPDEGGDLKKIIANAMAREKELEGLVAEIDDFDSKHFVNNKLDSTQDQARKSIERRYRNDFNAVQERANIEQEMLAKPNEFLGNDKAEEFLRKNSASINSFVSNIGEAALNKVGGAQKDIDKMYGPGSADKYVENLRAITKQKAEQEQTVASARQLKESIANDANLSQYLNNKTRELDANGESLTVGQLLDKQIQDAEDALQNSNSSFQRAYGTMFNGIVSSVKDQEDKITMSLDGINKDNETEFKDIDKSVQAKMATLGTAIGKERSDLNRIMDQDEFKEGTAAYYTDEAAKLRYEVSIRNRNLQKREAEFGNGGVTSDAYRKLYAKEEREREKDAKVQEAEFERENETFDKVAIRNKRQDSNYMLGFLPNNPLLNVYRKNLQRKEQLDYRAEQYGAYAAQYSRQAALYGTEGTATYDSKKAKHYQELAERAQKAQLDTESKSGGLAGIGGLFKTGGMMLGANVLAKGANFVTQTIKKLGKEALQFSEQWDTAMAGVSAKSGLSGESLTKLGDTIEKQATKLKVSSVDLAKTYKDLFAAGFTTDNIEEAAEAITKFSTVTGQNGTQAVKQLSQMVNSGLTSSLEESMDKLTAISDLTAATPADISKVYSKMAAMGTGTGMSEDQTMALATFASESLGGSASVGNDLGVILSRLGKVSLATTSTKEGDVYTDEEGRRFDVSSLKSLEKTTGISFLGENGQRNPFEVLQEVANNWQDMSDMQRNAFANIVGGSSGRQSNTFMSLMNAWSNDPEKMQTYMAALQNSEGTVNKQYEAQTNTVDYAKQKAKSAFTDWASDIIGTTWPDLQKQFYNGISNIFGSDSFTSSMANPFESQIDTVDTYISFLDGIKDKYDELGEIELSNIDASEVTSAIASISSAFPQLAISADGAVTSVAQLVGMLEQLIALKNQLSGEQTESNAMNADYQKVGEQYIKQMEEAERKKSGYSAFTINDSAKTNWKSVGNAFFNDNVSTDSDEYKVKQMLLAAANYTGNTWSKRGKGIAADMKSFIEGGFDTSKIEKDSPLEQTLNALFADYQSYLSSKNGGYKYNGFMNTGLYDLLGTRFLTGFYTNEQYNQDTTSAARTAAEALFTNFQLGTYTGMDETLKEATIQYIQDNYVKQNGTWDNTMYTNFMKDQNSPIYRYLTETTGKLNVSQYQQDQLEADNYQYYMMDADGNVIPLYGGTAKEALTYANEKYAGNVTPEQLSQLNNMYDAATTAYNLKVSSYKDTWGVEPIDELKIKYANESGFDKFTQLGFNMDRFLEQGATGYKEMFLGSAPTTTIDYGQIYSRDTNEIVATNFADIVNTNLQTESGQKDAKRNMLNYIAKYGVDAFLASTRNTDRTLWDNQGIYASLISGNEELGLMFKSIIDGDQSASSIGADLVTTLMKDVYGSDVGTEVSGLYSSVGKYSKALARQKRYNAGIIGKSDLNEIDTVLGTTTQWSNENEAAATMALYDQYLREQEASITATSSQLFNNVLGENAMFASRAQAESVINNRDSEDVTADMVAAAEAYIKVKDFADAIGAKDLGNGEWSFDTIMPSVTNPLMEAIVGKTYLENENKANLQTLLLSGTNFATAFAGEVDEEGIQNALLSFGGSDLETYLKYMQAKAGGADITSDQDYIDARNALYDKAYNMSNVDQGYIGVQLAKDMQNEDGTFKTAEQVNALIDANEQYRIFIANNQAARTALNDFSEGQIEASEATLKVQKAVNRDAESVAALTKKSTEARQAAERANYYLQKAKAGTLSTKTESTDKDGKDKQAVKEGKEVASILGIKEDTLSKFTQKQLEAMLQVQTAGLEQAYTDSLTGVIQDSFDNAMTTSTNELGETVYEAPGIKIKAGETQVIGLAEASGILGEMGYAAVSSEIAAWCANGGEGHLVITGGENSVKVVAEGSVTGGASGGSSSSSGGGGGGGGGKSKYAKAVEKWKSKIATSEHLIKMVKSEETKYEDAGNYAALNNMVELENVANVQQIKEYEAAIAELKPMMSKLKKDSDDWNTLRDAIRGFEESIADLNNTIEANKRKLRENREEMRQTRTELENMIKDAIEANEQTEENMLAGTVSMQDLILDALRARYQAEWDLVKEDLEKKKEALEEEKSLIEERLQARKDAESEANEYSKLAELQNQLALVSMDTTMSSQAAELRNQIAELQNNLAWKQAETLTEMATTNIDKQIEGIDQYIEDEDERVQSYIDNANNFSLQVYEILEGSSEEIMQWLKNNSEDYNKLLVHAQEQQLDTWEDTYKQMMGITDTYWDLIGDIISGGWGEIMQYMQTTDEYINASATGKLEMLYEWQTKYEEYMAAFEGTQLENGYDDYLSIIEEAIDSGDLELASKYLGAYVELMNGDATYEHTDVWSHKKTGKSDGYSTTTTESISSGTEHTTSTDIPSTVLNSVDELSNMLNYDLGVLSGDISDLVTSLNPLTALATNFLPYVTDVGGDMFGTTNNNIGDINITINQAELSSDEAIETVAEKVGNQFLLQLSQQSGMKFFDFI